MMFSLTVLELIKEVITSWQVIAVTIGIILYLNIVFYVARYYRTPKLSSMVKKVSFKRKKHANDPSDSGPAVAGSGDSNDELGLEEE